MDIVREIALKIIYKIDKENAYTNIELDKVIKENEKKLNERDIGFISEIVYGVTSWKLTLDEIIKIYSNLKMKKISPWILNILRMGIYQIIFLDKVPKSASVNESVNLAKRYGHKGSSNFVNAILRKVDKKDYTSFFEIKNPIERISKTNAMPVWIIEELLKDNSIEDVEQICKASNIKPKVTIRVNNLKTNKKELKKLLQERGIEYKEGILDDFLVLDKVKHIEKLDLFKQGYFTIQDEGAGLIAKIVNPKQNEIVLDACSSPGGKTTYMAELMENTGEIFAWDLHSHRVKLVEENATRLGISNIKTEKKDASIYHEEYNEKFDKILLDVPCSGVGVLKRKPDIKWKREAEDILQITKIQKEILQNCSKYLKSNGQIVYSTCSLFKEENDSIIDWFLEQNQDFTYSNISLKIDKDNFEPKQFYIKENSNKIQLYPSEETDGFFICKFQKK